MPSVKRRMNLTIPDDLSVAFDDFREATGMAPASFVVEILMQSVPMIKAMSEAARLAKQGSPEAFGVLSETLAGALHSGSGVQVELLERTTTQRKARSDKPAKGVKRPRKVKVA